MNNESAHETHETPLEDRVTPSHILHYFKYKHLPPHLQETSKMFHDLAWEIEHYTNNGPEKSVALRKLLESKDAAVRANVKVDGKAKPD